MTSLQQVVCSLAQGCLIARVLGHFARLLRPLHGTQQDAHDCGRISCSLVVIQCSLPVSRLCRKGDLLTTPP